MFFNTELVFALDLDFKGALWNFAKYIFDHIFVKFKYLAKEIINSFSPDYKLSNGIEFAQILRA